MFYYKINNKYNSIFPAPSKLALKVFGGYMSINEYREKSTTDVNCMSINPIIHISSSFKSNINNTKEDTQDLYNLSRNTPLNTNSNITNIMQLKINKVTD